MLLWSAGSVCRHHQVSALRDQGVWWQGKSQSFLVMASPTDQIEKKETEGWKKRGHGVPPYFMPAQIWPRLGNFLVAKSFWEHALLFGRRGTCIQRGIPLLLLQEAKTHRGLLGRLWAALLILESQCKREILVSQELTCALCESHTHCRDLQRQILRYSSLHPVNSPDWQGITSLLSPCRNPSGITWYGIKTKPLCCSILHSALQGQSGTNRSNKIDEATRQSLGANHFQI